MSSSISGGMNSREYFTNRWKVFLFMTTASMLIQTNIYLLIPNYQLIEREFRISDFLIGAMTGFYILMAGLFVIIWGYFDR